MFVKEFKTVSWGKNDLYTPVSSAYAWKLTASKNYLKNRTQLVKFNGKVSKRLPVNLGVPQGSILGPILFLFYVNDLSSALTMHSILYADDTTMVNKAPSAQIACTVNATAQSTALEWFTANNLTLNINKTVNMLFSHKNDAAPPSFDQTVKFLGMNLDSKLRWNIHGENVAKEISKNIFLLSSLKNQLLIHDLRTCYFSLSQSHLQYGLLLWGHKTSSVCSTTKGIENLSGHWISRGLQGWF